MLRIKRVYDAPDSADGSVSF